MQALLYILLIGVAIYQGRVGGIETQYFANIVADNFVFVLRWFSIPLIGISLLYTGANIKSPREMYRLGKEVIKYTFSTTYIAALVALGYYLLISPKDSRLTKIVNYTPLRAEADMSTYGLLLFSTIFFAIGISLISLQQNEKMRGDYAKVINKMYDYLQIAIKVLLFFIPLAMYAFIVIFVAELQATNLSALMKYLSCVVLANLTQAFVVLPTFMLLNKVNPVKTLIGSFKALVVAFWSKSSSFALPVAIECATENLKVNEKVANFSLPLCISVNMNACAAFILTTVLFVSECHGVSYTALQLVGMTFVASIAAIGNAGVPMGCFTLATLILSYTGTPLYLMGIILPAYSLIDMLESAINVWSDLSITSIVSKHEAKI